MGVFFVCPNCRKRVNPMSANATMAGATKQWQHKDCRLEPERKRGARAPVGLPVIDRRRWPRR